MTPPPQDRDESLDRMPDRALWRRCRLTDAPADASVRFLDLAGFAEGRLDPDEHDRIAALLIADPIAAADVEAARSLAGGRGEASAMVERIVARASALRPDAGADRGLVLPFLHPRPRIPLQGLARWGSLAAALAIAAWLGFTMGSDASMALSQPKLSGEDAATIELFDPATGFLHDPPTGVQT